MRPTTRSTPVKRTRTPTAKALALAAMKSAATPAAASKAKSGDADYATPAKKVARKAFAMSTPSTLVVAAKTDTPAAASYVT